MINDFLFVYTNGFQSFSVDSTLISGFVHGPQSQKIDLFNS